MYAHMYIRGQISPCIHYIFKRYIAYTYIHCVHMYIYVLVATRVYGYVHTNAYMCAYAHVNIG